MLYFLALAVKVDYIWIHDSHLSAPNRRLEQPHEHVRTLRRRVRLRDGRRQRRCTVLVHAAAARRRAAAGRRGGAVLVSSLSGTAYRAMRRRGAAHAGRVNAQRAVRKNRIISRLAFGPLPSV